MSKITDAFNGMKARIEALLPSGSGFKRLPNPYIIDQNGGLFLEKGWGLARGPGNLSAAQEVSCIRTFDRDFIVTLTRESLSLEADVDTLETIADAIYEDQFTLIKDFEGEPALGLTDIVANTKYSGDNGIQLIQVEEQKFMLLQTVFTVTLRENLQA